MNSLNEERTIISYEELRTKIDAENTGTICAHARPLQDEIAWKVEHTIKFFIDLNTHPVWYMDPSHTDHRAYNEIDATKIRFVDAVKKAAFLRHFQTNRHPEISDEAIPSLIVFHCSTCDNYAVIDGNHRLTRFILSVNLESQILVYGLSGSEWPSQTPDMEVICSCLNEKRKI